MTYAHKIDKEEARIDWRGPLGGPQPDPRPLALPGRVLHRRFRQGPERVKVLRTALAPGSGEPATLLDADAAVACGEGAVRLSQVQRAGKSPMAAEEFLRGRRGSRLGRSAST